MNTTHLFRAGSAALMLAVSLDAAAYSPPDYFSITRLDVQANDIAANPIDGTLLATLPSAAGPGLGNTLARFDPVTGALRGAVFVGSEPGQLALSRDGSSAYIGMQGAPLVRRYDLHNNVAGATTYLGRDPFFGYYYAEDIAVKPDDPDTIVVSRQRTGVSPRHGGVAAYVNGIQLSATTQDHTGSNRIEFGADPNTLVGLNNESTEFGLRTLGLDGSGVHETQVIAGAGSGFGSDFKAHDGLVYFSSGQIFDPALGYPIGRYSVPAEGSFNAQLSVVLPTDEGVSFGLHGGSFGDALILTVYDQATFVPIASFGLPEVLGAPQDLELLSNGTLALRTTKSYYYDPPGGVYLLAPMPVSLPVPEPASVPLMVAGLGVLSSMARLRRGRRPRLTVCA